MRIGAMQPYFFPYLGYYDLINRTDRWVVFDVVKYVPKSWMNRNRILHPTQGWQYVTVPVDKHASGGLIKDARLVDKASSRTKILGQIEHYRHGRAPFFSEVRTLVEQSFDETQSDLLRDLNVSALRVVCRYLGVSFDPVVLSTCGIKLGPIAHAGAWALEITAAMGAQEYLNPPGGREIFIEREFEQRGIGLRFTELVDFRYATGAYAFVERLSILDVLMWNAPEAVKGYLDGLISAQPLQRLRS